MAPNPTTAQDKTTEAAKANIDRSADQGARVVGAAQDGISRLEDLREQTAENTRQIVQTSLAAASHQAREVSERFTRTFGIGSEDSQQLAEQSKRNLDAIARCGTVLTQAFQDASRDWAELGQKQWRRNFDGMQRLARVRTAHEFATVQSELVRESMQHLVEDGRVIAERSLRAAEEAGKTFANAAAQGGRDGGRDNGRDGGRG